MWINRKNKDFKTRTIHKGAFKDVPLEDCREKRLLSFFNLTESFECFISVGAEVVNVEKGGVAIHGTYLA